VSPSVLFLGVLWAEQAVTLRFMTISSSEKTLSTRYELSPHMPMHILETDGLPGRDRVSAYLGRTQGRALKKPVSRGF